MDKKYITNNKKQTQKLGEILAEEISKNGFKKEAVVLGLQGNLGGGKTTFLQGFAKGLGINEKILSPTFVILKRFKLKKGKFENFYHIDCYRIKNEKDIADIGLKKIISDPKNIVAVEWPERIKKILPRETIYAKFIFLEKNKREIII